MIWAALLVGILIGIAFVTALDWISVGPVYRTIEELETENAELKKQVATLHAQLEALEHAPAERAL